MSEPSWARVITLTVEVVLGSLIVGWLARGRLRKRPRTEAKHLAHTTRFLIFGLVCFALFVGLAALSHFGGNETSSVWTTLGFLGFASLGLLMLVEYSRARHELIYGGLSYGRTLGSRGKIKWSEVSRVRYNPWMQWFKLETRSRTVVRVSAFVTGLSAFADTILKNVSAEAIDSNTLKILVETAEGKPPKIW